MFKRPKVLPVVQFSKLSSLYFLRVCVCVCLSVCLSVSVYVYVCICESIWLSMYVHVCMYVCVYLSDCMCMCMCVFLTLCVCVCLSVSVYVCVCVCVCVCVGRACMCEYVHVYRGQRLALKAFFYHFLPYLLETESSTEPRAHPLTRLIGPESSRNPPIATSCAGITQVIRDPSSGAEVSTGRTLRTVLSPQPLCF